MDKLTQKLFKQLEKELKELYEYIDSIAPPEDGFESRNDLKLVPSRESAMKMWTLNDGNGGADKENEPNKK